MKGLHGLLPLAPALVALAGAVGPAGPAEEVRPRRKALVFPIEDVIGSGTARDLKEAVETTLARYPELAFLVLRLDTPGGHLEPAQEIARFLFRLESDRGIRTIAWIPRGTRALSAGSLIALACRDLVMGPDSRLGDAAPVAFWGQELGEKIQSVVRQDFEYYAEARGRPVVLAQAMVSKSYKVYRVTFEDGSKAFLEAQEFESLPAHRKEAIVERELIVRDGDLLTVSERKAEEYGLADMVVLNFDDLRLRLLSSLGDEDIIEYGTSGLLPPRRGVGGAILSVFTHPFVRFLLIVGGVLGLFIEFHVPGFGVPGIVGIACFVIFFAAGIAAEQVGWTELAFFALGMGLLLVELLVIPGFGVAGVLGIVFLFVSLVLSLQSFTFPRNPAEKEEFGRNVLTTLVSLGAAFTAAIVAAHYMPRYPLLRRLGIIHEGAIEGGAAAESGGREGDWVGREGVAVTALRPAGKARIDGKLVDVVALGDFVPKGTPIVVVERKGSRTVVQPRGA